jgi:hypothetical protein
MAGCCTDFIYRITRKKAIPAPVPPADSTDLKRVLGWKDLIMFGVGSIIGNS